MSHTRIFFGVLLLVAFRLVAAPEQPELELLWRLDLESPESRRIIEANPYAKLSKDADGTAVLTVTVPKNPQKINGAFPPERIEFPVLPVEKFRNRKLVFAADITHSEIGKPKDPWNGLKFMAILTNQFGIKDYWGYEENEFGPRNWFDARLTWRTQQELTGLEISCGLQDSWGETRFKNIRIYAEREYSVLDLPEVPQVKYTFQPRRGRGAMSPSIRLEENDFAELAKWGANLIRWQIFLPYKLHGEIKDLRALREAYLVEIDKLTTVLNYAEKYGIMVVLDIHPFDRCKTLFTKTPEGRKLLTELWLEIIRRHGGHPMIWGYDLINEPFASDFIDEPYNKVMHEIAQRIRRVDPQTPIILEITTTGERFSSLPVWDDIPNVIYSKHFYWPGHYTTQGLVQNRPYGVRYPDPEQGLDPEGLRKAVAEIRDFQLKTGARIYIGEFGVVGCAEGAAQWLTDAIEMFEEYGWDWTFHAFREWPPFSPEHETVYVGKPNRPYEWRDAEKDTDRKKAILEGLKRNRQLLP